MDPNVAVMGAMPRTPSHHQKQYFFLCHGFPAAPGMPLAAPSVLGTMASNKNVRLRLPSVSFSVIFCFSVVTKNENHPLPNLKPTAEAVEIKLCCWQVT